MFAVMLKFLVVLILQIQLLSEKVAIIWSWDLLLVAADSQQRIVRQTGQSKLAPGVLLDPFPNLLKRSMKLMQTMNVVNGNTCHSSE
jgi:hypothetical protein